jgi:peptidoglycan/LPS O-acetylase OafA/YrhL
LKKLVHLEALRGLASVYVAAGHWALSIDKSTNVLNTFLRFGQEAVILFFLLSGFVIFISYSNGSDKSLKTYFIKRARRIYFPLICAFIISIVIVPSFSLKELVGNILMLQDFSSAKPGVAVTPFQGNSPLWSLSYEWTFYLLFPFLFPVLQNNKNRVHYIGIFSVVNLIIYILFPNHIFLVLAYFIVWWSGLELAEYFFGTKTRAHCIKLIGYYILILFVLGLECGWSYHLNKHVIIGFYPYLIFRHFGFAFICIALTVFATRPTKWMVSLIKPFSKIAPISYGIYIIHFPILTQASFGMPPVLEAITKISLVFLLAYLIEIVLQPKVNKLIDVMTGKQKQPHLMKEHIY